MYTFTLYLLQLTHQYVLIRRTAVFMMFDGLVNDETFGSTMPIVIVVATVARRNARDRKSFRIAIRYIHCALLLCSLWAGQYVWLRFHNTIQYM